MSQMLRKDADRIISASLKAVLPDEAVQRALRAYQPRGGRTLLVAAGKAAWQMAAAAVNTLGHVDGGVVVHPSAPLAKVSPLGGRAWPPLFANCKTAWFFRAFMV